MIDRLCIIGVGLIGGSLAKALRAADAVGEIVGYGRSVTNLNNAVSLGVIDEVAVDLPSAVRGADMIVVATPIGSMEAVFEQIRDALSPGAVVTDVGSVKTPVIDAARASLDMHFPDFVPGHPIAGTERSGVTSALVDLFEGKRVILTPESTTDAVATAKVREMWRIVGADVVDMTPEEHDRILAASSHLPHALSYALVDMIVRMDEHRAVFDCSGGGFRDFTRIAASDPTMWRDICLANREALLTLLRQYQEDLGVLAQAIERGDAQWLWDTFARAKRAREQLGVGPGTGGD